MRRLALLALVALAAGAPFAGAAQAPPSGTFRVDAQGFYPNSLTVLNRQSVRWTNTDAVVRRIASDDGAFDTQRLAPGASYTHTFDLPGLYLFRDPDRPMRRGAIIVLPAPARVTLSVERRTVVYGQLARLYGFVSSADNGEVVTVFGQRADAPSFQPVLDVVTGGSGDWRAEVRPTATTTYRTRWNRVESGKLLVSVRPFLELRTRGPQVFTIRARIDRSLEGVDADIQRRTRRGGWERFSQITIGHDSFRSFRIASLPRGRHVLRAYLPRSRVGAEFLDAFSDPIVVNR